MSFDDKDGVPIGPLLAWWRRVTPLHNPNGCTCSTGGACSSVESLARTVRVSHTTMYRRFAAGVLDVYEADRWATALGVHPCRIWPGWDRVGCVEDYELSAMDEVPL